MLAKIALFACLAALVRAAPSEELAKLAVEETGRLGYSTNIGTSNNIPLLASTTTGRFNYDIVAIIGGIAVLVGVAIALAYGPEFFNRKGKTPGPGYYNRRSDEVTDQAKEAFADIYDHIDKAANKYF